MTNIPESDMGSYMIYELLNMNRGQIYQDFSDDGEQVRHGMWALQPYSVGDGMDSINEEIDTPINEDFIKFVELRENYMIRRPIFNITTLSEAFSNAVAHLPKYVNESKNEKIFINNLLNLQEYLVEAGAYNEDCVLVENELDLPIFELHEPQATKVANYVANKLHLPTPQILEDGCGSYGCAFKVGDKVLKVTSDASEVVAAMKIQQAKPRSLVEVYNVWKLISNSAKEYYFVILMEYIDNKPKNEFHRLTDLFYEIADAADRVKITTGPDGEPRRKVLDFFNSEKYQMRRNFNYEDFIQDMQFLLTAAPDLDISPEDRKRVYDFVVGIANIKKDLLSLGLEKNRDFTNLNNLGYRDDGTLVHFDVGGVSTVAPPNIPDDQTMEMDEAKERPIRRLDFVFNEILKIPVNDITQLKDSNIYSKNKDRIDAYMKKNPHDAEFFYGMLDEDGSAKFSTDTSIGRDDFPTYNQNSTEPSIENNLDANSAMYTEDLEYSHADDATKDEYVLNEAPFAEYQGKQIYVNPPTIKNLAQDARGFLDVDGNLYMIDDGWNLTHSAMMFPLLDKGVITDPNDVMNYTNSDRGIAVQKVGNTNYLAMSEGYKGQGKQKFEQFKSAIQKGMQKNPRVKFLPLEHPEARNMEVQALQQQSAVTEDRKKAWVPGSKSVTVKKKCRLGGLGNTSVACNQGDINNLEFGSLKEDDQGRTIYSSDPLLNEFYTKLDEKRGLQKSPFVLGDYIYGDLGIVRLSRFNKKMSNEIELQNIAAFDKSQGVGSQMMQEIVDVASEMGVTMTLDAKPFGNDPKRLDILQLINFYKKFGFQVDLDTFDGEFENEEEYMDYVRKYPEDGMSMIRYPNSKPKLEEDIDPKEAYRDEDAFQTLVDGKRNVAIIHFAHGDYWERLKEAGLRVIGPINQDHYGLSNKTHIVYRPEGVKEAKELYQIMLKNRGYVPVNTPEETRRIGELLGYRKESIDAFIDRHFDEVGQKRPHHDSVRNINEEREMIKETDIMTLQDLPFRLELERMGGKIYAVGGSVRDSYIGKSSKDLDVVITGIPADVLEKVLSKYGQAKHVGKSFGVYKFVPNGSKDEIDIALPRTEKSTGPGHKDFEIVADHKTPLLKDLERRDFTINAIAKDVNGTTIDPFNGLQDISNGILRVVGPESFSDDPLRMLRGVQFAARFGFKFEPETLNMLTQNVEKINTVPKARIEEEFEKIIKKGDPLMGAKLLQDTGMLKALTGSDEQIYTGPAWNEINTLAEFLYLLTFQLVDSPTAFAKAKVTDEKKIVDELESIEKAMRPDMQTNDPIENRKIAGCMYDKSPKSMTSKILPRPLQRAAEELNSGRFPKNVGELEINGDILQEIGIKQGKPIGEALDELLTAVYEEKIRNNKEELINFARTLADKYLDITKD